MEMNRLTSLCAPMSVNLEITNKCNLSCSFCFNASPVYEHMIQEQEKKDRAEHNLNLSKLHSKVSEAEGWDYYFFLEIEAPPQDKNLIGALKGVKRYCSIVRILGIV